jgi:DNA-binding phage protein
MTTKTRVFDPANYLASETELATYVAEVLKEDDLAFVADAVEVLSRARAYFKQVGTKPTS